MLRELTHEEVGFVAGGIIIVTGAPPPPPRPGGGIDPAIRSALMGGSYGGYLLTQALIPQVQTAPGDVSITMGDPEASPDTDGDGVADDADADPNNPNVQNEIVVNGVRQDTANAEERNAERLFYVLNGRFANLEIMSDGRIIVIATNNPTEDQLRFKHNYDKAKSELWFLDEDEKPNTSSFRTAQILTDAGIDVVSMNLSLIGIFREFQNLVSQGLLLNNPDSFTNWIWDIKLGGRRN